MTEVIIAFSALLLPAAFFSGILFGKNFYGRGDSSGKEEKALPKKEENPEMVLRNGLGVTRDRNPSFAEQIVNVLNYCGEDQTEGDYEESEGADAAEHLG